MADGDGTHEESRGYLRNQWDHLSNILKYGIPEISNNLSEQRVKPIKLSMKTCLNVGSEEAAKKHAFMHSLAEMEKDDATVCLSLVFPRVPL